MSSSTSDLEKYQISLEEILLATENFNKELIIGDGGYGVVYKGQLSERWQNKTAAVKRLSENSYQSLEDFHRELEMIICFHHENVNAFLGYCHENNEMMMLYEYAVNRSLDLYLLNPDKMRFITWERRLKICIDTAKGIKYLHSGVGDNTTVIHRNVKSANIVFDHNMTAQICGFDLSIQGARYQPHSHVYTSVAGTKFYLDPVYIESGILRTETDVYSFGVVMFELLSGMIVFHERSIEGDNPGPLMNLVRRYYEDGLEKLIDPHIKDQIDSRAFYMFKELACKCLSFSLKERPTMAMIITTLEEALEIQNYGAPSTINVIASYHQHQKITSSTKVNLENFIIPINEIRRATKNFSLEAKIGDGGYGWVYKGQLSERWENRIAAIKRLSPDSHQGEKEFLNELQMMSGFYHENIIPLIGYCNEGNQMIIVSEYAVNGSLDYHLREPKKRWCLTWVQRLKICLGAARGINYLHTGLGGDKRVIHRDIKSANVLLDEHMEAKICDFGLSKSGFRNHPHTHVYTKAAGTHCYLDPIYRECGILRKESDVYSFGVILFEILSGMLAYYEKNIGEDKPQHLMNLVRRYADNELEKLIDPIIRDQIDDRSLHTFQEIAYQCISFTLKERPTMQMVIEKIEESLEYSSTG